MSKNFKSLLLFVSIFLFICLFTPIAGKIYELIVGYKLSSGFWGTDHPEYFEGFFISYSFFTTLALTIFGNKKKYSILAVLLAIIFLIQIVVPESLIVSAGAAIVAWLLGQLILFIKRKVTSKK